MSFTLPLRRLLTRHTISKFLERFNILQSNPTAKTSRICKIASMCKSAHPNIDNTDTEDDTEDGESAACPANAWMDKWKNYINTVEDVPDGMDLVRWWGVCILFHLHLTTNIYVL
jgi:hypothetical protein